MKSFVFEIRITERDVEGDEFWEDAIEKDGTGITDLTEAICMAIDDINLITSGKEAKDVVFLKSYEEIN